MKKNDERPEDYYRFVPIVLEEEDLGEDRSTGFLRRLVDRYCNYLWWISVLWAIGVLVNEFSLFPIIHIAVMILGTLGRVSAGKGVEREWSFGKEFILFIFAFMSAHSNILLGLIGLVGVFAASYFFNRDKGEDLKREVLIAVGRACSLAYIVWVPFALFGPLPTIILIGALVFFEHWAFQWWKNKA